MKSVGSRLAPFIHSAPPGLLSSGVIQSHECGSVGLSPLSQLKTTSELIARLRGRSPLFVCVAAHTDTSEIPGLSSAGSSTDLIPYTAAADLEALEFGRPRSLHTVPSNPLGPPGPALITRAALALAGANWIAFHIGLRVSPQVLAIEIPAAPGGRIDQSDGVPEAESLFQSGIAYGRELAEITGHLVIGETVPGGTTTAMAVLRALNLPNRVSASSGGDSFAMKAVVVEKALARASVDPTVPVLQIVRRVGDGMQAFVAGMVIGASPSCMITLAGGTQMAAVLAILHRLEHELDVQIPRDRVMLATTPWVARDPYADLVGIINAAGTWCAAIPELNFASMSCRPLRLYESFLVKEGVGAGGMVLAAVASGSATLEVVHAEIDQQYLALEAACADI